MAPVLLLIDLSKNLLAPGAVPDAAKVSAVIEGLLTRARSAGALVIHARPADGPGAAGPPGGPEEPGRGTLHRGPVDEPVVEWEGPHAFAGSGLAGLIPVGAEIIVAGAESEEGVRATALAALDRGHRVVLVRGAHASHRAGMARETEATLRAAGVVVVAPESVTFEGGGGPSDR
ncbi:cysteine hydrolase family protein [Streptomyces marincola]|uniref:Isochorismatase-like domain-containing protein n=1 Tax=Streptomyces marincola TaxID=2878388 RepID=A0A1W7CTK6_9ACTN|nr:isochorismatase family protein [Streptomyces marincola]ARQ68067.1 hypothetical protein CAG99_03750 [Streptomyces marincola]